jgi:AAA15 family ATPase/GTPase
MYEGDYLLRSLSVKNFRGIKEGKIEGLGQINIFIGKNNSGKSTLLDCMHAQNQMVLSREI